MEYAPDVGPWPVRGVMWNAADAQKFKLSAFLQKKTERTSCAMVNGAWYGGPSLLSLNDNKFFIKAPKGSEGVLR